jgi:hypothetical protein
MEPTIRWVFTNVILALIPIVINLILIKMLKMGTQWHQMLKDGELFIFSTTLSASSIGIASFQGKLVNSSESLLFWALIVVLIISTALFSLSSLTKLKQIDIDEKFFATSSIACALAASAFSYMMASVSKTI